jgi:type I restriction enzyme S subunit
VRKRLRVGWRWATLGEVGDYLNGRAFKPDEWGSAGLPIIRIQNLTSESTPFNYFAGATEERHRVEDGDLLVSWSASLDAYIWQRGPALLNQHIFKVREKPGLVTRDYLYYAVRYAMGSIRERVHGATMQHVTKPEFELTTIPLPPLAEHRRRLTSLVPPLGGGGV